MENFKLRNTETPAQSLCFIVLNKIFPYVATEAKYVTDKGRNFIVDIVCFDSDKKPLFIVETKGRWKAKSKPKSNLIQVEKYRKETGLPVYLVRGMEQVPDLLNELEQDFDIEVPEKITLFLK